MPDEHAGIRCSVCGKAHGRLPHVGIESRTTGGVFQKVSVSDAPS
jgi:hypothetical protein